MTDFVKIVCPSCGQTAVNEMDAADIESLGECLGCDHVRGERAEVERGN